MSREVSDQEIRDWLLSHQPRHFGHWIAVPWRIAHAIMRRDGKR